MSALLSSAHMGTFLALFPHILPPEALSRSPPDSCSLMLSAGMCNMPPEPWERFFHPCLGEQQNHVQCPPCLGGAVLRYKLLFQSPVLVTVTGTKAWRRYSMEEISIRPTPGSARPPVASAKPWVREELGCKAHGARRPIPIASLPRTPHLLPTTR